MVLHEYYIGNMIPSGRGEPAAKLVYSMQQNFGAFDLWQNDFMAVGSLRGVGWAVLYEDPATGQLSNHWIELHHQGVPTGFKPILVMDVWEHAFLLDYKPAERGKYIEAFFSNLDWNAVNDSLADEP
jgi:Fe-Mn family superoxide dismutase